MSEWNYCVFILGESKSFINYKYALWNLNHDESSIFTENTLKVKYRMQKNSATRVK